MKKVLISSSFKRQIAKEFNCSLVTIEMAYKYVTNSKMAQNIRQRAKELQQKALNEIVIDANDLKMVKSTKKALVNKYTESN